MKLGNGFPLWAGSLARARGKSTAFDALVLPQTRMLLPSQPHALPFPPESKNLSKASRGWRDFLWAWVSEACECFILCRALPWLVLVHHLER